MNIDEWIERFKKAGIAEVDDVVHDTKSSEASRINNEGLRGQLEYLIEEIGESGLRELLPPPTRHVVMTVAFDVVLHDMEVDPNGLVLDMNPREITVRMPSLREVVAKVKSWQTTHVFVSDDKGGSP